MSAIASKAWRTVYILGFAGGFVAGVTIVPGTVAASLADGFDIPGGALFHLIQWMPILGIPWLVAAFRTPDEHRKWAMLLSGSAICAMLALGRWQFDIVGEKVAPVRACYNATASREACERAQVLHRASNNRRLRGGRFGRGMVGVPGTGPQRGGKSQQRGDGHPRPAHGQVRPDPGDREPRDHPSPRRHRSQATEQQRDPDRRHVGAEDESAQRRATPGRHRATDAPQVGRFERATVGEPSELEKLAHQLGLDAVIE